ncbi:MAG: DUF4197 family protein [Bdellovibrionota bacterium]
MEQAQPIQKALETVGAEKLIADTTLSLNRAAEDASGVAKDVLIQAVKALTFQDAMLFLLTLIMPLLNIYEQPPVIFC